MSSIGKEKRNSGEDKEGKRGRILYIQVLGWVPQRKRTNKMERERERGIYCRELVHKIMGLASAKFAGQAGRIEILARVDVLVLSM